MLKVAKFSACRISYCESIKRRKSGNNIRVFCPVYTIKSCVNAWCLEIL